MKPSEINELVALVSEALAYWKQDTSKFTIDVWVAACKPYTLDQVRKAVSSYATNPDTGRFPPKVADIVKILSGTTSDRAQLAWGKVFDAMSSVGAYSDVVFDDPAIHAAIQDLGGWPKVCRHETGELSYLQHRFCEVHKAYTGRQSFDYPRRLSGDRSPDHEYERRGIPLPRPAVVGNPEVARVVYSRGSPAGKTAITFKAVSALKIGGPDAT